MAFPQGSMVGSDPPAEGGMGVHMPTLRDADRGIPNRGVAPVTGRKLRIGIAAPAAVVQPQGSQQPTEALACTWNRRFPCTCTPLYDVHASIGIDPSRSASKVRLQTAVLSVVSWQPSIVAPGSTIGKAIERQTNITADQRIGPASGSRLSPARYAAQSSISRRRRSNRSVRR